MPFVTYTFRGMVIERIYFDANFFNSMLLKLEQFFFKHYAKYLKNNPIEQRTLAARAEACTVTSASTSDTPIETVVTVAAISSTE